MNMYDRAPNWINLRWSLDGKYCRTEDAPILRALLERYGKMFDDIYNYQFHGHKLYIVRYPHFWSSRSTYRIPTEKYSPHHRLPRGQTILRIEKRDASG